MLAGFALIYCYRMHAVGAACRASAIEGEHMEEYDVVISGYGPTGQTAASLLSRLGHRVAVFERWPTMYGLPRLCSIDGESCRIVQAAGDVDAALSDSTEVRQYKLVDGKGEILLDITWDDERVCG